MAIAASAVRGHRHPPLSVSGPVQSDEPLSTAAPADAALGQRAAPAPGAGAAGPASQPRKGVGLQRLRS